MGKIEDYDGKVKEKMAGLLKEYFDEFDISAHRLLLHYFPENDRVYLLSYLTLRKTDPEMAMQIAEKYLQSETNLSEIDRLRKRLEDLVAQDKFEDAVIIKTRIDELKKKIARSPPK